MFTRHDLEQLDRLLYSRADRVVPMRDVWKGDTAAGAIGLRHDVDDNPGSFDTALAMAEWEMRRGYSSTWFLLHDSHYWTQDNLARTVEFEEMGHEVAIHVNGIAEALRQNRDPVAIVAEALAELREFVRVEGCVAHGDPWCYRNRKGFGPLDFVNDEMWLESQRPDMGDPCRIVSHDGVHVPIAPVSRVELGLGYDASWLSRGMYLSDSGGGWSPPLYEIAEAFGNGQLHVLQHPDHWLSVFEAVPV